MLGEQAKNSTGNVRLCYAAFLSIDIELSPVVGRQPVRRPVSLPVYRVEIAGHAALDADTVGSAPVAKRTAQIMLPATEHSLDQAFGRIIKSPSSLRMALDLS